MFLYTFLILLAQLIPEPFCGLSLHSFYRKVNESTSGSLVDAVFLKQSTKLIFNGAYRKTKFKDFINRPGGKLYPFEIKIEANRKTIALHLYDIPNNYNFYFNIPIRIDKTKRTSSVEYLGIGLNAVAFKYRYKDGTADIFKFYYDDYTEMITKKDFIKHDILSLLRGNTDGFIRFSKYEIVSDVDIIIKYDLDNGKDIQQTTHPVRLTLIDKTNNLHNVLQDFSSAQRKTLFKNLKSFFVNSTSDFYTKTSVTEEKDATLFEFKLTDIGRKELINLPYFFNYTMINGSIIRVKQVIDVVSFYVRVYHYDIVKKTNLMLKFTLKLHAKTAAQFGLDFNVYDYNIFFTRDTEKPLLYIINNEDRRNYDIPNLDESMLDPSDLD